MEEKKNIRFCLHKEYSQGKKAASTDVLINRLYILKQRLILEIQ